MKLTYAISCIVLSLSLSYQSVADSKAVIGWIEPVILLSENIHLKAKIDTGADNTSLHASDLKVFRKHGEDWVRFELQDQREKNYIIERPVVRYTLIKRRGVKSQERPVIHMKICLANQLREVEVNLTDRSSYNYKLLIGRSYLQGLFLVDSDRMFSVKPECKKVQ